MAGRWRESLGKAQGSKTRSLRCCLAESWSVGVFFAAVDGEAVQPVEVLRAGQGGAGKPQGEGRRGVKSQVLLCRPWGEQAGWGTAERQRGHCELSGAVLGDTVHQKGEAGDKFLVFPSRAMLLPTSQKPQAGLQAEVCVQYPCLHLFLPLCRMMDFAFLNPRPSNTTCNIRTLRASLFCYSKCGQQGCSTGSCLLPCRMAQHQAREQDLGVLQVGPGSLSLSALGIPDSCAPMPSSVPSRGLGTSEPAQPPRGERISQ